MPRELVAVAPRTPVIREYEETPLKEGEVRLKSEFSAPKHGTELGMYRGSSPFSRKRWEPDIRLFFPLEESEAPRFPLHLGNMTVGVVTEVCGARRFKVGDRVFGHLPIRETHTVAESRLHPMPDDMSPEEVVYWDPAEFALGAVRDGQVRLGDCVVVFGLGAIGLMTAQMCRLGGARLVVAVDPIKLRREASVRHGADIGLDPAQCDVAFEVRKLTDGRGADVAIEASGNPTALHEAIRVVGFGGRVSALAFYEGDASGLFLGEEWHFNRITLYSSRSCSDPNRDHPLWDDRRIKEEAFRLLKEKKLRVDGLVHPVVKFEDSAEAYRKIDEEPQNCIKLGVVYE